MKNHFLTLLLILCAWPGASTAQAASPGTVVAWGADVFNCNSPIGLTPVPVAVQSGVTAIAAGGYGEGCTINAFGYTVALKSDGSVLAWGSYVGTNVPDGLSGVTAIAAGAFQALALKHDGSVLAWGYNCCGETDVPIGAQSGVTAIAAGGEHTVALKNDGTVVAWGYNTYGQVTGTPATSFTSCATTNPVTLGGQVLIGVTAIAAGGFHTVALKNDGTVVAWGDNSVGQLTVPVAAQSGVTAIAAGAFHTVALKNDGTVVAWGGNWSGQTDAPSGLIGVTAIAAGGAHTVALKNDGTVVAWGDNYAGQVTGTPATSFPSSATANPVTLGGQVLSGVTAIAAGWGHTVALVGTVPMLPALRARPSGNELILSWSTNAVGFTLQSTCQLTPPVTWVEVTNPPAVLGAQWTTTNAFSGSAQFYRLQKL